MVGSAHLRIVSCAFAILLFLGVGIKPAAAGAPRVPVSMAVTSPVIVFAGVGDYFDRAMDFVRQAFGSRMRMIQVVTIGACIGLFIILRK